MTGFVVPGYILHFLWTDFIIIIKLCEFNLSLELTCYWYYYYYMERLKTIVFFLSNNQNGIFIIIIVAGSDAWKYRHFDLVLN